ncbi:MAG: hypothetical protein ABJN95_04930 [Maribacter sp.]|uniref:beta strand repeat-containing protein n=1 Tax=Maribacter sp. TaxID=1897614 RepID=UPI003299D7B8
MCATLSAQVKIGDNPQNIDPSSVLELESTDKVLVITRVSTAQMNAIVPSQGALCFNTDLQSVHYYDGTQWVNIGGGGTGGPLTADAIVNTQPTIVITPTATGDNLEVAPNSIRSEQIVDGGINGVDIQDGSIGQGKLQDNSVTQEKLSENSVGAFALDNDNIGVSAFNNDAGYITAGDITSISADAGNAITAGSDGGAYYDDTNLLMDVMDNAADIAADNDQSPANEIQNPTLTGTILGLTNTAGTVDLGPLISAGGSDDQNIGPVTLDASNILSIGIENGMPATVDLSSLAGGTADGSETIINPTATVTVAGTGTALDPYLLTAVGGGTGGAVISDATLTGDGSSVAAALGLADDAVTTAKILDANVTDAKIAPGAADQILRTAPDGLSVGWVDLPTGGAVISDATLIGDGSSAATALGLADDAVTTAKILDANVTTAKIAPAPDLTPAADQMLITTDAGVVEWAPLTPHMGTAKSIFFADTDGTPTTADDNVNPDDDRGFFWDTDARQLGAQSFGALFIGLEPGNAQSNAAKVHIADNFPGVAYALQLQNNSATVTGRTTGMLFATEGTGSYGKGALVYEYQDTWARGDFHFLQRSDFGPGTDDNPDLSHRAFTIKNNSDIVLYGGIDVDGTGLGTAGQVLSSTGTGVQWINAGSSSITLAGDVTGLSSATQIATGAVNSDKILNGAIATEDVADDAITAAKIASDVAGIGLTQNVTTGALEIADDAITTGRILDGEVQTLDIADDNVTPAKIAEGTNGQVLTTDALGDVVWAAPVSGAVITDATIAGDGTLATPLSVANDAITTGRILDGEVQTADIADNNVTPAKIAEGTNGQVLTTDAVGDVVWAAPAAGAVTTDATIAGDGTLATPLSVANNAITTGRILDGEVQTADIADAAITSSKLAIGSVQGSFMGTSVIIAGTIGTADIGANAIGNAEIQTGAVRTGEIFDGTITDTDIDAAAAIVGTKVDPDFGAQDVLTTGNVGGNVITAQGNLVTVTGSIFKGATDVHPDYVFQKYFTGSSSLKDDYDFSNLTEVEAYLKKYYHLPGIKSAQQVEMEGVWDVGKSNLQNLEKIEELFLYTIEQEKKIKTLESDKDSLLNELEQVKKDIEEIKAFLKDK